MLLVNKKFMTTVINTPRNEDSSVMNAIIGVLILVVVAFLFFAYALPAIRNIDTPKQDGNIDVNVKLPAGDQANTEPAGNPDTQSVPTQ